MFGTRYVERGRVASARPGENKILLVTAPNEKVAEAIGRSLGVHGIESSARPRRMAAGRSKAELPRPIAVDIHVRSSDLERARRIARRYVTPSQPKP